MPAATTDTKVGYFVEANGLRFHYRDLGERESPSIVFLHGIMGHSHEWEVLLTDLAAEYRVIALDQRGHGRSQWADSYTPSEMAADVLDVIDALGLRRTHLVGHSMGAIVSMLLAADYPERIDRLVLIDIAADSLDPSSRGPDMLVAALQAMSAASYPSVQAAVDEWLAGAPLTRESLLRHYVEYALTRRADGNWVWRFDAANLRHFVRTADPRRLRDALGRIEAPTLLIRGQHSEFVSAQAAADVLRRLRNASYTEVPNGAHDLGVQQPEAVAAAVRAFVGLGRTG